MKKVLYIIIIGLSINVYAQDIEKLGKKELRIALRNNISSKDSLKLVVNKWVENDKVKTDEIIDLKEKNRIANNSFNDLNAQISTLQNAKAQSLSYAEMLLNEVTVLKDSITKLKLNGDPETAIKIETNITTFSSIPAYKECFMIVSENKSKLLGHNYVFASNENTCIIYINSEKTLLNRIENEVPNKSIFENSYSNETYSVRFQKKENIASEVATKFNAEMVVTNKVSGQVIVLKIFVSLSC